MVRRAAVRGALLAICLSAGSFAAPPRSPRPANLARLPLVFEENRGQADPDTRFLARGQGFRLQLGRSEVVLDSLDSRVTLTWLGATTGQIHGISPTSGVSNYFLGEDSSKWVVGARHYTRVQCESVFPGIDLVFYGNRRQMEFDWVVGPWTDPSAIRFRIDSEKEPELTAEGELRIGEFLMGAPMLYQETGRRRSRVDGAFRLNGREVSFQIGAYDRSQPLIIDPTLVVSYIGGRDVDIPMGMAVDANGYQYITGYTASGNFPITSTPYKGTLTAGDADAFVVKVNPAGSLIMYSTFVGGTVASGTFSSGPYPDYGRAIAVDAAGAAYITGSTVGRFPTTGGAFSAFPSNSPAIFASKLDPNGGTLVYSTYIDGAGAGQAIAVDSSLQAYIAGYTYSATLTTSNPAVQKNYGGGTDGFIVKLNSTGTAEVYATFLGGSAEDQITGIKADTAGQAYVTGFTSSSDFPTTGGAFRTSYSGTTDAFVAKVSSNGNSLAYSTFLGGSNLDRAFALDINSNGEVFVAGQTYSPSFPTTAGAYHAAHGGGGSDAFVVRVNSAGSNLVYSTFLGGSGSCSVSDPFRMYTCDAAYGIVVDALNQAYVVGLAGAGFPLAAAPQSTPGGNGDAFVALLDATGSYLHFSTYVGGGGTEVATAVIFSNASGPALAGFTSSTDLPVSAGALQSTNAGGAFDGFYTRLAVCSATLASSGGNYGNAAGSFQLGVTAPAGCAWYATTDKTWVTLTSGGGVGNGSISFNVAGNPTGPLRVANISVLGQTYVITQAAGCYVTLGLSSSWFNQTAYTNLSLPVFSNCAWTASTQQSWINISPSAGFGNGTILYSIATNGTGVVRTGSIAVNTESFTINQLGGAGGLSSCTFALSSHSESFGKDGGSSSILVMTQDGCEWMVTNPNSWVTLTSGSAGSGSGVIGYTVQRNTTGSTRSGLLTFGTQTLQIVQSGN
ncbi:MAG: hypothetical protein HY820_04480 [Acidobacteria bacterium]|nr:hypothetical protein [Acidobacteriota bacterium]